MEFFEVEEQENEPVTLAAADATFATESASIQVVHSTQFHRTGSLIPRRAAFWKTFLEGDHRYMRYLTAGYARSHDLGAVVVSID